MPEITPFRSNIPTLSTSLENGRGRVALRALTEHSPFVRVEPVVSSHSDDIAHEEERQNIRQTGFFNGVRAYPPAVSAFVERMNPSLITFPDVLPGETRLEDWVYHTPLSKEAIERRKESVFLCAVKPHSVEWLAQFVDSRGENNDRSPSPLSGDDMVRLVDDFYTSLAWDWKDPHRQEGRTKVLGYAYERLPLALLLFAASQGIRPISPEAASIIGFGGGALVALKGAIVEALARKGIGAGGEMLGKHALHGFAEKRSPLTRMRFRYYARLPWTKVDDVEFTQAIEWVKLQEVRDGLDKAGFLPSKPGPLVDLIDPHVASGKNRWNNPPAEMKVLDKGIERIMKQFRGLLKETGMLVSPEARDQMIEVLSTFLGDIQVRELKPGKIHTNRGLGTEKMPEVVRIISPTIAQRLEKKALELWPRDDICYFP